MQTTTCVASALDAKERLGAPFGNTETRSLLVVSVARRRVCMSSTCHVSAPDAASTATAC
jgi:hypothetical protein